MTRLPVDFFAFPLNLILALVWIGLCVLALKSARKSLFVRFMLSPAATFISIGSVLCASLAIGLTGDESMTGTWWFAAIIFFMQTVLLFVIMRRWRSITFLLLHLGLLVVLSSAFWGAPDVKTLRMHLFQDVPCKEAVSMDGRREWLDYELVLKDFTVDFSEEGIPVMYEADVLIDGCRTVLKVNHPYDKGLADDIYLISYDDVYTAEKNCTVQIVREPRKYAMAAGIIMLLAGALLLFITGPDRRTVKNDD